MAETVPYQYAVLAVVPDIERGERLNVAVVLFCRQYDQFLGLASAVDDRRIAVFAPELDPGRVGVSLAALDAVAAGHPSAGALGRLPASERFGWLVAPSSTLIQPGPVHTGLTDAPAGCLDALLLRLVCAPDQYAAG